MIKKYLNIFLLIISISIVSCSIPALFTGAHLHIWDPGGKWEKVDSWVDTTSSAFGAAEFCVKEERVRICSECFRTETETRIKCK